MRTILIMLLASGFLMAQVVITPSTPPAVNQGGTSNFSADVPVVWSMAPGSAGSIDSDGTYHAPAQVKAKQSLGGCQVLPNNHVFNTRIDNLPVHAKSATWMAAAMSGTVNYLPGFPVNTITSALPTTDMVFAYTPANNGPFRVPAMPDLKIESGWYTPYFTHYDRHIVAVETDSCTFQDIYNFYPVGANTYNPCPLCNSQSGARYSGLSYTLPTQATDAAGMPLLPLSFHRDEILTGSIQHALRVTVAAASVSARNIWPAQAYAGWNQNDVLPFGARVRLKSTYTSESTNPYTQALLTQLKQYGLIISDIGFAWQIQGADTDLYYDPQINAAFSEISAMVSPQNLEVVDESSLMVSADSGFTGVGAEIVVATRVSDGTSAQMPVVLTGVTIGAEAQFLVFQAGSPGKQIGAWVHGAANASISWSMQPGLGTLTGGGIYTPPSSLTSAASLTITASANADPSVTTTILVTLLPSGALRINAGGGTYKDSQNNDWLSSCCAISTTWDYGDSGWSANPDIPLYRNSAVSWGDLVYKIYMPPGNYRIRALFAEASYSSPGVRLMHLESQGQLIYRNVDVLAQAGFKTPIDYYLPAVVGTDGLLSFAVRHVEGEQTMLAGLQIEPDSGEPMLQISPADGGTISPLQTKQFYAVAWYWPDQQVLWRLSPQIGSIDSNGLYAAPAIPLLRDTMVTVAAASAANPSLSASATLTIRAGVPPIRVNCGGGQFTDALARTWAGDRGYTGGVAYGDPVPIANATSDMQALYQSSRYGYTGEAFQYSFETPNGVYSVTLKWAEYRSESQGNLMRVAINGQTVLTDFDPVEAAGGVQRAVDRVFEATVTDNVLQIDFVGLAGSGYVGASINGIEIVLAGGGELPPGAWNLRMSGTSRLGVR